MSNIAEQDIYGFRRTRPTHSAVVKEILKRPEGVKAELCRRDFSYFIQTLWPSVSHDTLIWNWHIDVLTEELSRLAHRVAAGLPREYDLIINVPPGTTKSMTCSVMFPVWCWTKWPWMRFIASSYSGALALEQAEISRELVRSDMFRLLFPEITIKRDKDTKSNFRVQKQLPNGTIQLGGNRYSTSVGGTLTGFHGHILLVDDPLDPNRAISDVERDSANRWIGQTLSTRKVEKAITPTVLIMQRLHQDDPTGHITTKKKNVRHICLPGEIRNYREEVKPPELLERYTDDLLDANRITWDVLTDMEADLGQYGYAGQVGQRPTPPGGGMFKTDHFQTIHTPPSPINFVETIRYWDKAGTGAEENKSKRAAGIRGKGARTAGVKMSRLKNGKYLITDVKYGRWGTEERERIIRETAEADGTSVKVYHEQEPGSGGKDSAKSTTRNLAGYAAHADRPTGDKVYRADPYSVQVNEGNVLLLQGEWIEDFKEEHRFFPFGTTKDIVDAAAGAFSKLAHKRVAGSLFGRRK